MKSFAHLLFLSALVVASGAASAGPRYYDQPQRHHYHHGGAGLGGLVFGLAVAVPLIVLANQADRDREPVYVPAAVPEQAPPIVDTARRPMPVVYPRNGQSGTTLEADSRECNRWATTQQAAMNDASVFQHAVNACMDGKGYTLR